MKIKRFVSSDNPNLLNEFNVFIKDKIIIDIKLSYSFLKDEHGDFIYQILVFYESRGNNL